MAISKTEAKRLCERHAGLIRKLRAAGTGVQSLRDSVKSAAGKLITQEIVKVLRESPVEELNHDKRGIRTNALREWNFNTLADLYAAPVSSIAAVNGISEDTAYWIKTIVNNFAAEAQEGLHIRLSTEAKTPAATELLKAVYAYRNGASAAEQCASLLYRYEEDIAYAMEDLAVVQNDLKWMFAGSSVRRQAEAAYALLQELYTGSYGTEAKDALFALERLSAVTSDTVWKDFEENAASYFAVLEEADPGIFGAQDDVYGLPQELAQEISTQVISLAGLKCTLRRYQEWGVRYILNRGKVLLGDEMGLGKTVQAIAAMVSLTAAGATHFMVICPASVLTNWCREIRKFSTLPVVEIHGQGRKAALRAWQNNGGVAVTTYETTGQIGFTDDFRYSMLVVDEAHYIKNPDTKRSQNVRRLSLRAERMLFMTGTALENRVDEMITLIGFLNYDLALELNRIKFLANAQQFRDKIAPVYYRRRREDVLKELPEKTEVEEWCTLNETERATYLKSLNSGNFMDVRRVSFNAEDFSKSTKAARLLELVDEAASDGRKTIVFSFFLDNLRKITALLGKKAYGPITGSVPPARRQEILDEFEKAPAGSVLVAQILSGGTGLNIQCASVVIICEPQFKPSIENQAISRVYRMGQVRSVLVYRLLAENTVDERITELLAEKQRIFDAFADESSAAAMEAPEIDNAAFGDIVQAEIDRIRAEKGYTGPDSDTPIDPEIIDPPKNDAETASAAEKPEVILTEGIDYPFQSKQLTDGSGAADTGDRTPGDGNS